MPDSNSDSPDTAHSAVVEDHNFTPTEGQPWTTCQYVYGEGPKDGRKCGLSRATHKYGETEHSRTEPGGRQAEFSSDHFARRNRVPDSGQGRPIVPPITSEAIAARTGSRGSFVAPRSSTSENAEPTAETKDAAAPVVHDEGDERAETMAREGHKDDSGKASTFYLPHRAKQEAGEVMRFGAQKYSPGNYLKGMAASRLLSASDRHVVDWVYGQEYDIETGKSHLVHSACCLLMLRELQIAGTLVDDRIEAALTAGLLLP